MLAQRVPTVNRLSLQFATLTLLVAVTLFGFRWQMARHQLDLLEGMLEISAEVMAGTAAWALGVPGAHGLPHERASTAPALSPSAELAVVLRQDMRLVAISVLDGGGRSVAATSRLAASALGDLPPAQPGVARAVHRPGASALRPVPTWYVFDQRLSDGRMLRQVYDAATLRNAWEAMIYPAIWLLVLMAVVVTGLFGWLLRRPSAALREATEYASALPGAPARPLAVGGSGLYDLDALRQGLNRAAALIREQGEALLAERRLLRNVFDADDAQIYLKDTQGRFVLVNASMQKYWDKAESAFIGRDSLEVFGNLPGVRESVAFDRQVWDSGATNTIEQRLRGPQGEALSFLVSRRLVAASGGGRLLLGIARDITPLREQALALERQEQLTREVIDLEDDFIVVKDSQLRYVLVNRSYARAIGREMSDLIGRTAEEIAWPGADLERLLKPDRRVLTEGVTVTQEDEVRMAGTGPLRRYLAVKRPITLSDGSVGVLGVMRDITDQREREASLRTAMQRAQAAAEARSRFVANISHEVRTPINGIVGLTDLTLATELTPQQREWLSVARGSADALLAILNDVLDLSKIDAGAMDIVRAPFDLHALLSLACHPLALRAAAKDLAFVLAIAPDVPETVDADAARVRQVVTNLVGNAVKFTARGRVVVRVSRPLAGSVVIDVEDTGPGIPAAEFDRIFEPFVQIDESATRRHGGTGLGLAISRQLAVLMGGEIVLESRVGHGSRFRFVLPVGAAARSASMSSLDGRRIAWLGSGASLGPSWLESWGATVTHARHPGELGHAAAATPVDTVVIDGLREAEAFDAAVRGWRSQGDLLRVVELAAAGTVGSSARAGERLPSARGLVYARGGALMTPRQLHALLSRRLDARAPRRRRHDGEDGPLAGLRVLLAEDNEVNSMVAVAVLERLGAEVVLARDGAQALDRLHEQPFDVALMDVQMPEMDGAEVVRRWRDIEAERGQRALAMVAMTAHAMPGDRERFLASGFDGYVGKPFTVDELSGEIERLMGRTDSGFGSVL